MSVSKIADNREWIGVIGGEIPLFNVHNEEFIAQLGVGASVFNRILKTPGHITVITVDYRLDLPIDIRFHAFSLRVGYGHISNHYSDDGIEILRLRSINAVKDYVQAGIAREIVLIRGNVYADALYSYHNEPLPGRRWMLQAGSDFGNYPLISWLLVYGAIDVKIREEVNWGSTQSYQVGFTLVPRANYAFRLAYTYRTGYEDRGQVYGQKAIVNLISIYIDF